jgi:hypothetical protein
MHAADELIGKIAKPSQIPSRKRRQEIQRELRTHMEDFITAAREAGRREDEIEKMVAANFGDPVEIAEGFAWVYRRERVMVRVGVFLLSSLAVTSLMLSAILALQTGIAIGFGTPVLHVLASQHTAIEALDILFTVTTYTRLVALEELFDRNRSLRALALLALAFAILEGLSMAVKFRAPFLIFGVVNGAFFRTIQVFIKSGMARTGMVVAGIGLLCLLSFKVIPFHSRFAFTACASWLAMGAAYRKMPDAVARMDAALLHRLQRI